MELSRDVLETRKFKKKNKRKHQEILMLRDVTADDEEEEEEGFFCRIPTPMDQEGIRNDVHQGGSVDGLRLRVRCMLDRGHHRVDPVPQGGDSLFDLNRHDMNEDSFDAIPRCQLYGMGWMVQGWELPIRRRQQWWAMQGTFSSLLFLFYCPTTCKSNNIRI
jgi:hypothetical protein